MLDQCPVCHSSKLSQNINYPRSNDNNFFTEIVNCDSCQSGAALPYKNQDELNRFYDSGAYWDSASSRNLNIHTLTQSETRIDFVLKRVKFKLCEFSTLDIGAGHGHIASALKSKNTSYSKNYSFIEPDNRFSSFIKSNFPTAQRRSYLDNAFHYDLIFLNHILEHTALPSDTLKSYTAFLNEGGRIYIEVPHRDTSLKMTYSLIRFFFLNKD